MAGELDRQIDIYTRSVSSNDFGETPEAFTYNRTIWAKIIPAGGGEKIESKRETATNEVLFIVRYTTTITEVDRIKWNGRYYDISKIDTPDRKVFLHITAATKIV